MSLPKCNCEKMAVKLGIEFSSGTKKSEAFFGNAAEMQTKRFCGKFSTS